MMMARRSYRAEVRARRYGSRQLYFMRGRQVSITARDADSSPFFDCSDRFHAESIWLHYSRDNRKLQRDVTARGPRSRLMGG